MPAAAPAASRARRTEAVRTRVSGDLPRAIITNPVRDRSRGGSRCAAGRPTHTTTFFAKRSKHCSFPHDRHLSTGRNRGADPEHDPQDRITRLHPAPEPRHREDDLRRDRRRPGNRGVGVRPAARCRERPARAEALQARLPRVPSRSDARRGGRGHHRARHVRGDRRTLLGGDRGAGGGQRGARGEPRAEAPPRRRVQAALVAVLLPGPRRAGPGDPERRGAPPRAHGGDGDHVGARRGPRGSLHGHLPGGGAQHAELRAPEGDR